MSIQYFTPWVLSPLNPPNPPTLKSCLQEVPSLLEKNPNFMSERDPLLFDQKPEHGLFLQFSEGHGFTFLIRKIFQVYYQIFWMVHDHLWLITLLFWEEVGSGDLLNFDGVRWMAMVQPFQPFHVDGCDRFRRRDWKD